MHESMSNNDYGEKLNLEGSVCVCLAQELPQGHVCLCSLQQEGADPMMKPGTMWLIT